MLNENKSKKILLLYALIGFGFFIFLAVMLLNVLKSRSLPSLYASDSSKAQRGSIVSADGFHIATTKKLYKAVVNTHYIDPDKKDLFVELFSIYSGIDAKEIRKKLNKKKGVVVLSYLIPEIQAQYLKKLAWDLRDYKVFVERKNPKTGMRMLHGLSILESGESREYPYGNLLTPIIGYSHKLEDEGYTRIRGVKGLEKRFDVELSARQDGSSLGPRDVNSYILLNKNSFTKPEINGLDVKLTIPVALQIKIEKMLDKMKIDLDATQIMVAVMNPKDGKVLTLASSSRFMPKNIQKSDYGALNSAMTEYSFEPGSVVKVITFAILLDKGRINPYEMVNGYNGRYSLGKKVITDEHRFDRLTAEETIIHSSNIGISQLAQKMSGFEFNQGLQDFGFSKRSTPDLIYERVGSVPTPKQLDNEVYMATCSYGYGMRANLMQLIRAYSVFNNNGKMTTPKLINHFMDEYKRVIPIPDEESVQVIQAQTAQRVKDILIKTVTIGTGQKTITPGLEVGGKTGTAHIVEGGRYVNKYNTAFLGFANDENNKYTIGAIVIKPKKSQFASQTAVPVFKATIDILVEDGYLKPNIVQ